MHKRHALPISKYNVEKWHYLYRLENEASFCSTYASLNTNPYLQQLKKDNLLTFCSLSLMFSKHFLYFWKEKRQTGEGSAGKPERIGKHCLLQRFKWRIYIYHTRFSLIISLYPNALMLLWKKAFIFFTYIQTWLLF